MPTWSDGVITTDAGEVIASPHMSMDQLMSTVVGGNAKTNKVPGTNYIRLVMSNVLIGGYEYHINEAFADRQLDDAIIELSSAAGDRLGFPSVPPFWERPGEVAFLQKWVRQQTGKNPPVEYHWGRIGASFDDKGGFARIIFRYT